MGLEASDHLSLIDLLDSLNAQAIAEALHPTEASIYRNYCRRYSKAFHTPLKAVMDLEAHHVIQSVFENDLDDYDLEENMERILETLYQIEDPEYDAKAEKELAEYAELAEAEEQERLRLGLKVGQKLKSPKPSPKSNIPESGGLDFSALNELNER